MKLGIQTKVGGVLALILLVAFAVSTLFSAYRTRSLLSETAELARKTIGDSAMKQARNIFSSLETGTKGSLERGEMEVFQELVHKLGGISGVAEIGLSDPQGKIVYSSIPGRVEAQMDKGMFGAASSAAGQMYELSKDGELFLLRAHMMEPDCLRCHFEARRDDLSGVLYVRYEMKDLLGAQEQIAASLSDAVTEGTWSGILAGLAGLIFASAGVYLLLGRQVSRPLRGLTAMMKQMEQGHLDSRLKMTQGDEIGEAARAADAFADSLQHEVVEPLLRLSRGDLQFEVRPRDGQDLVRGALARVADDLNEVIARIFDVGRQISAGSAQVAEGSQILSEGATEQSSSLERISGSLETLTDQTRHNAGNAAQTRELVLGAAESARRGDGQMAELHGAMEDINVAGESISRIIKTIDEIAFQTNLLALNAAVEAARAGQHGKGFAVVAEEVRNLAARSSKAAAETSELISSSVDKARKGREVATRTAEALTEIVQGVGRVSDLVGEIASASEDQARGIEQISDGLGQVGQVTQRNTATAEESAASADQLSSQVQRLRQMLEHFQLRQNAVGNALPAGSAQLSMGDRRGEDPRYEQP